MARVDSPVHWIRLLVAVAAMGLLFWIATAAASAAQIMGFGLLFVVPFYVWLVVQGAQAGAGDGALLGLILGMGAGAANGYGAYNASSWLVFTETEKDPAAFWGWFIALTLVNVLLGAALGSMHARKDIDPTTGLPRETGSEGMPELPDQEA